MITIREALDQDFEQIWPFFKEIAAAGETYAYPRDVSRDQAYALWMDGPRKTYVAEQGGQVLGSYYLKTNQPGPGNHVCNCGYMVAPGARGKGVARAMCEHSQTMANELGYQGMQFNFVVSTNEVAVSLWQKCGFDIVGRLPNAYQHASKGLVDALVMYKWLAID